GLHSSMSCQKASSFVPVSMTHRSDTTAAVSPCFLLPSEDALAEQEELGSSEHLAFDHLDVSDPGILPAFRQAATRLGLDLPDDPGDLRDVLEADMEIVHGLWRHRQ
ncbi:hypothetical protein, partial [Streptomyces lunaelactis]|uniref:hypothetical protein n=1 Tax=Streptomyces lunaelactis TaxID=1535768 RepID=UPI001C310A15